MTFQSDEAWAAEKVAHLPASWAGRLLGQWRHTPPGDHCQTVKHRTRANVQLRASVEAISAAWRGGVAPDANDAAICQAASDSARDMARRLGLVDAQARGDLAGMPEDRAGRLVMLGRLLDALHWLTLRGLADALRVAARRSIPGALKRVVCEHWWRRVLRRLHAVSVEGTARSMGLVHKRAGCYVSDDSAARRRGQAARNAAALQSVQAVNDDGQAYTLAELAAKGTANKAIRRHELMTRIAGFETIARDLGHLGDFITLTCPSRMHAWRTVPGQGWRTEANPHHDGTTPDAAQAYLCQQWRRFRAAADRAGLGLYGFRIAEPNHDGTPHWHALLFFPPTTERGRCTRARLLRLLRRYFLWADMPADLASRRAACRRRIKVESIDWNKGSAAGYVAKYVAKNIDGMHVEKDLYGNDTLTSSQRVEAWASTWRIRQFQQLGGAPVGVWRELRRLHPDAAGAAPAIAAGLAACNAAAGADRHEHESVQRYTAANGWADYLRLQGGHRVKRRSLRVQLLREATGEIGRYGEVVAPRVIGVATVERITEHRPAFGIVPASRVVRDVLHEVESQRANWIIVPMGQGVGVHVPLPLAPQAQGCGAAAAPWSPVNNCTRAALDVAPGNLFAPAVRRFIKRGRAFDWASHRATPPAKPAQPESRP